MKILFFLSLLGVNLHQAVAVTHSLKFFLTASSGLKHFPDFVVVGMVDEIPIGYCDSIIKRAEAKQDWTKKMMDDDPQHLEWYNQKCLINQQVYKDELVNLKQQLNQTEGVHIYQNMYGCEWDDETGEVYSFDQYGYDGEDFLEFDLKTLTWIAQNPQAVITKHKWDNNRALNAQNENYLSQMCPDWLKKYLDYGKTSLLRTDRPSRVSLLQKTPSSPVSCHATGFYPNRAMMFWRKDGEELHNGLEPGEILPNHDGSFQMSVDLDLSSIKPEDWRKYECVFHLSGVKDDIVTELDKAVVRTNWGSSEVHVGAVIGAVVGLLALVAVIAGYVLWKRNLDNNGFKPAKTSETASSSSSSAEAQAAK